MILRHFVGMNLNPFESGIASAASSGVLKMILLTA
jgi:hypothetical protein